MTTPAHHRPRRGRVYAAMSAAAALIVAGLVLLVTGQPGPPGSSAQAIAGPPGSTSTAPESPGSPPSAGAAAGDPVPASSAAGEPPVSGVPGEAPPGTPGQPTPASGPGSTVPGVGPGSTVPGQPGSSSGSTGAAVPGGPGGLAGSPGNPANAAAGGTGGGGTGISDSARSAARAATPPAMPPGTLAIPALGVGPSSVGPVCAEPAAVLEPPNRGPMLCTWHGSAALDAPSGMTTEAGHINYDGRQGAFSNLAQLRPGEAVYTASSSGRVQVWVVTRAYSRPKTLPLDTGAFAGPDGPRALVLVSCGGDLIPGQRSYAANIYVFASPA